MKKKLAFGIALLALALMGSVAVTGNNCETYQVDNNYDEYIRVSHKSKYNASISVHFVQDATGSNELGIVTMYHCSRDGVANSCNDFDIDVNGDGIGDQNTLGGASATIEELGQMNIKGFNFLRLVVTLSSGVPELTICRTRSFF